MRLTVEQVIENNKRIVKDNNLKNWQEIHAFTLKTRLENKENK